MLGLSLRMKKKLEYPPREYNNDRAIKDRQLFLKN